MIDWTGEEVEVVADAIDEARFKHPVCGRERPRPFAEADKSDREYATRLARAALAAARQSDNAQVSTRKWKPGDPRCDECDNGLDPDWVRCPFCLSPQEAVQPEYELKCTNGHYRCYLGPCEACPYCERIYTSGNAQVSTRKWKPGDPRGNHDDEPKIECSLLCHIAEQDI